jgi:hypothetical protein
MGTKRAATYPKVQEDVKVFEVLEVLGDCRTSSHPITEAVRRALEQKWDSAAIAVSPPGILAVSGIRSRRSALV